MNGAHPTESTPPTSSHGRGARTSGPRLEAVDALRALALLGILSVNVWYFLYPGLLESGIRSTPVESAADQLVRFTSTLLFEAKSYVVFSFLFGLSFVLAWASAARAGLSEVRRSVRRFVALIVLGVLHGMFLFAGDILLAYAILGFALLGMRRISTRWALIIAAGVLLLWSGFTLVTGLAASALEGTAEGTDLWDESVAPVSDPESARQAYTGGLGSYLGFQLSVYPMIAANMFFGQGPMAFAAFLIGLVVGRSQLIERIIGRQIATTTLLAWTLPALAVGLGLSGTAAVMLWGPPGSTAPAAATAENMMGAELTAMGMLFLAGPIQAAGYVVLALLIFRSEAAAVLVRVLAPAGRMSLTNYLGQSVALVIIFSGLGFGLAGQLSPLGAGVVLLALWVGQLGLSALWFSRFSRGPVETPVRAWTYAQG